MDWTQIIIALIAALTGGSISAFVIKAVTIDSIKRKASAEAEDAAVEPLRKAIEILNLQLEEANNTSVAKDQQIAAQSARILELTERITALYDDICIHKGCKLRKPHLGQGQKWYDEHSDDPSMGCDFMSVEWLLKLWRKKNSGESSEG